MKKKLDLTKIKVESFTTSLDVAEKRTIEGGTIVLPFEWTFHTICLIDCTKFFSDPMDCPLTIYSCPPKQAGQ
jgi:hypothetical protein